MDEGIIKDKYELIIKEVQTIVTVCYLIAIGIGMLFNYQKFSEFGINIFEYADVFDFLIAPFSDFKILLFILISFGASYFFFSLDKTIKSKYPKFYSKTNFKWDNKPWYNSYRYVAFSFLLIFYLFLAADLYGKIFARNIDEQATISIRFADNELKKGKMIGKTNDILFLLNNQKVEAIPITSLVKEFQIEKTETNKK